MIYYLVHRDFVPELPKLINRLGKMMNLLKISIGYRVSDVELIKLN